MDKDFITRNNMSEETKKLIEAWDDLDERCPDCGHVESGCHEAGCLSSSWTDADTKEYRERVKHGNTNKLQGGLWPRDKRGR